MSLEGSYMEDFLRTLITTNRSHEFFVDWAKVRKYRDLYKDELALLSSVSTAGLDPETELTRLLEKYPRIAQLIPLLVAVRPKKNVLPVVDATSLQDIEYDFSPRNFDESKIVKILNFTKKTGLLDELATVKNHNDYYFGVEVGLDTNGRKNRSGTAMENLIEPFARELVEKYGGKFLKQKNFEFASKEFGVKMPPNEKGKRGDFMLLVKGQPINIEVNFFDGGGSKQEIMNSYIPRAENLKEAGWIFALVTDGAGWKKNKNQVELGFRKIKNIYNAKMCREGKLEELIK
jgi:type II restriction enzyme